MSPGFAQVPNELVAMKLGASVLAVYVALDWHRNGETGRCDPSIATLTETSGLTRNTVIGSLKKLELVGFVEIRRRPNETSEYKLPFAYVKMSTTGLVQNEYYPPTGSIDIAPPQCKMSTRGSAKSIHEPEEGIQKKRTNSTDTNVSAGDKNLIAFWIDRSREYHGGLCPESGGKVAGFFKRMKHIPDEMHRKAIPAFFKLSDQWLQDHGYTIEAYEKRVGALIAQVQGKKKDEPPWEGGLGRRRASNRW